MANRVVDAIFRMRDEFSKPLSNCIKAMGEASRQGNRVRKQFEKVGEGYISAGKTLTAAVTAPIIGMGAVSYKSFEDVSKNLKMVEATMGEAKWATADLEGALKDAMANSIYSMQEGSGALVNYARQGWDAKQAVDMLTPSLNLAAGTATDLNAVTGGLGNTLKAFGADASEATKYADMFTVAQAQANTDVQSLFDSMSVAGPIAKTVGWQFEDIATLVGTFGDMSIDAVEGANALKTGLARLSGGNATANKAMSALGISLYDDNGHMLSMVDTIGTLQEAFNGMSEQEQMLYASQLFGANQMSKWLALINGPAADALQAMRDNISDASGQAQEAADAMMTPIEKLKSAFDVLKYTIGETLAPVIQPLIERLTELVDSFRKLEPAQQQQIIKMAAIAAAVGPLLMAFGHAVVGAAQLMRAFSIIKGAATVAQAALAAFGAPALIVAGAFAAVVAAIAVVVTHLDWFREAWSFVGPAASAAVGNLISAVQSLASALAPIFGFIGDLIAAGIIGPLTGAIAMATPLIQGLATLIQILANTIRGVVNIIAGIFTGDWARAWDGMKTVASGSIQAVIGVIGGLVDVIGGIASAVGGAIDAFGRLAGAAGGASAAASGAVNTANSSARSSGSGAGSVPRARLPLSRRNASGTSWFEGGVTQVNEKGPEIIDLPVGSRIYPHERSLNMARREGAEAVPSVKEQVREALRGIQMSAPTITIPKLADSLVVREEADIDRIGMMLERRLTRVLGQMGGYSYADLA